jgi:hypothetical protein
MISGDSRGLFNGEPRVLLTIKICRVSKFCQTAFNSVDGALRTIVLRFALLRGVLVKSGAQFTRGLLAG